MLFENIVVYYNGEAAYTIPAGDLDIFKSRYPHPEWSYSLPLAHIPQS